MHLTYEPATQTVRADARLNPHHMGRGFVSEGWTQTHGIGENELAGVVAVCPDASHHLRALDAEALSGGRS
jgi:hypothetical protein